MQIIINADDFGISEDLNSSVERLHKLKLITSATLISNGPSFNHAVKVAKSLPELGIGVHLTLDGPFNVLTCPSSLIDNQSNHFYNAGTALNKLRYGGYKSGDIYREYCAQIERIYDHGLQITHIDHHHHYHLYYKSLNQVIRVARKYNIKCIRSQVLLSSGIGLVNKLYRGFHQFYVRNGGLITTNGYFDFTVKEENSFVQSFERLNKILHNKLCSIEMSVHPFDENSYDVKFLLHPDFSDIVKNHQLINYKDLLSSCSKQ